MSEDYMGISARLLRAALSLLLAAVALWAAVELIKAVWVWLLVGSIVCLSVACAWHVFSGRFRRW